MLKDLLTTQEVATACDLSPQAVAVVAKIMPEDIARKFGRAWAFTPVAIDFIRARKPKKPGRKGVKHE